MGTKYAGGLIADSGDDLLVPSTSLRDISVAARTSMRETEHVNMNVGVHCQLQCLSASNGKPVLRRLLFDRLGNPQLRNAREKMAPQVGD
jgi:hypothetical protein